jgi:hypothetical protein
MRFILSALTSALTVTVVGTLTMGSLAHANELDNEAQVTNETKTLSKDLPQTLVIRSNPATGEVQVMHTNDRLPADMSVTALVAKSAFLKADLATPQAGTELDRDSSSSSWYFCWNRGYSNPYYWYGGYNFSYNYYYGYNYSGWNYGYYRWNWGWY